MDLTDETGVGEPDSGPTAPAGRDTYDAPGGTGAPVAKRVAPVLMVVALGWLLRQFLRRRNPRPRRRGLRKR